MTKYCLVEDDDGHWYVIPTDRRVAFDLWLCNPDSDPIPPEWAEPVGGSPSLVEFTEYMIA